MRKITVISALIACTAFGTTQAYALDEVHIAQGTPAVCPIPSQEVAQMGQIETQ